MKTDDLVLIQFGQNDGGAVNDTLRARGSIAGLGEETQEIDNLITKKPKSSTPRLVMRKMIADTKARGAKPIVLGLTVRDIWEDGKVERAGPLHPVVEEDVAKAAGAPFVDAVSVDHIEGGVGRGDNHSN